MLNTGPQTQYSTFHFCAALSFFFFFTITVRYMQTPNTIQAALRANQALVSHLDHYCHYSYHSLLLSCCTGQHFNQDYATMLGCYIGSFALWKVCNQTVAQRKWHFQRHESCKTWVRPDCKSGTMHHCLCQDEGRHLRCLPLTDDGIWMAVRWRWMKGRQTCLKDGMKAVNGR